MTPLVVKFNEERVHALYPEASMVPAMKMWQLPKNKRSKIQEYADSGDYLASLKIDGYCYTLNRTLNHVYLFSRSEGVNGLLTEKSDRIPHISKAAEALPPDTLLMGEIFVAGGKSKDVTRIMGSLAPKAIARQEEEGYLYFYITDVITYNGTDLRNEPFEMRAEIMTNIWLEFLSSCPYILVAQQVEENIYETATQWIEQGEEGAVLRKKDSIYVPEGRPAWSSIKIKPEETIDVIITGFEDPTKEYKGAYPKSWEYWVDEWFEDPQHGQAMKRTIPVTKAYYYKWKNAIQVSAYDKNGNLEYVGTISSGLTDEMRAGMAAHPEDYLNKVIEVKCMSVDTKEHTLRHGYLVRFRDDKNPSECLISEIFK